MLLAELDFVPLVLVAVVQVRQLLDRHGNRGEADTGEDETGAAAEPEVASEAPEAASEEPEAAAEADSDADGKGGQEPESEE